MSLLTVEAATSIIVYDNISRSCSHCFRSPVFQVSQRLRFWLSCNVTTQVYPEVQVLQDDMDHHSQMVATLHAWWHHMFTLEGLSTLTRDSAQRSCPSTHVKEDFRFLRQLTQDYLMLLTICISFVLFCTIMFLKRLLVTPTCTTHAT